MMFSEAYDTMKQFPQKHDLLRTILDYPKSTFTNFPIPIIFIRSNALFIE